MSVSHHPLCLIPSFSSPSCPSSAQEPVAASKHFLSFNSTCIFFFHHYQQNLLRKFSISTRNVFLKGECDLNITLNLELSCKNVCEVCSLLYFDSEVMRIGSFKDIKILKIKRKLMKYLIKFLHDHELFSFFVKFKSKILIHAPIIMNHHYLYCCVLSFIKYGRLLFMTVL